MSLTVVTEEAVARMRAMAEGLLDLLDTVRRETEKLHSTFDGNHEGLGPHSESIRQLVEYVADTEANAAKPIAKLALKLQRAASLRQSILERDRYASGRSGGRSYVEVDGVRHLADDNGTPYARRNGETKQYEPLPNTSYELGGYHYQTDASGNVIQVSGTLRLKGEGKRKAINDTVPDMLENDERGHLIGDQFGGSNRIGNLVAMGFDVNRSDYRTLEESWARSLEDGKRVEVNIEPLYEDGSKRPAVFIVSWETDGVPDIEIFENYET